MGTKIPGFLTKSEERIVLIDDGNLSEVINYHKEGFAPENKAWLNSICLEDKHSLDITINTSLYHNANLIDSNGNVIIEKTKSRSEYLLKAYSIYGEISLFGLAKAHYFGTESSGRQNDNSKLGREIIVQQFYEKVNDVISEMTKINFNKLMKESNLHYVDGIIKASLDFNPSKFGIETYRDSSFDGFEFSNYIRHPFRFFPELSIESTRKPLLPAPDVILIKAGTGTGKTELAIEMIKSFHRQKKTSVVISNLRSVIHSVKSRASNTLAGDWLLKEQAHGNNEILELNITSSDGTLAEIESSQHLFTTIKSLSKQLIYNHVNHSDLVIIDEAEKVFEAIYSNKDNYLKKHEKDKLKYILKSVLGGKSKVILLDADLTDLVTTSRVKEFASKRRIVAGFLPPEAIGEKESKSKIETFIGDWDHHCDHLLSHKLKPNSKNFIVCDSKATIENWLISTGYSSVMGGEVIPNFQVAIDNKVLAIVAVSKGIKLLKEQIAFLANPSEEIHKYDTVIVSPVLKEGFHIDAIHADKVTIFASGVLVPKELIQFASRLRTATTLVFALQKSTKSYSRDYYRFAYTKDERFESMLEKHRKIILSNLEYALITTLKHEGFNLQNVKEVFPRGDFPYEASPARKQGFAPEILSMVKGEKELSLHSQDDKKISEAVMALRCAISFNFIQNKTITVLTKSNENGELSLEGMFDAVAKDANKLKYILPKDLNVEGWKGIKGKTGKVNQLLKYLGFESKRTSAGAKYIITKIE